MHAPVQRSDRQKKDIKEISEPQNTSVSDNYTF